MSNAVDTPKIVQGDPNGCGVASIAMIAGHYGRNIELESIDIPVSNTEGLSIKNLVDIGKRLGFRSRALVVPFRRIEELTLPVIIHWKHNHYVVLVSVDRRKATVHDPAVGVRHVNCVDFEMAYSGVLVEFENVED